MGIEWFRDLSITILAFTTTFLLIFIAVLVYSLYRTVKSTLVRVQAVAKTMSDTVAQIQEGIKPLLSALALVQGVFRGFQGIGKMFKKESKEGG
jgi:hypothetical protein